MKKRTIIPVVAAVLACAGFMVRGLLPHAALSPEETLTVKVAEAPIEQTVDAPGWVTPYHRVRIRPNIAGRIDRLLAQEGQHVSKGQVLAWMSSTDRASILDAARLRGPKTLAIWEKQYKATPLISPVDGTVIVKPLVEGQTVTPSVVIYNISDTLIVMGQVDEADIGKVHVGMPALVTINSDPEHPLTGKVLSIRNDMWRDSNNVLFIPVRVKLDRIPANLRSQMSASIKFIARTEEKALVVPTLAVLSQDGVQQVLVKNPTAGAAPVWRRVRTGIEDHGSIEIVAGLRRGDFVLIRRPVYVPQDLERSSPLIGNEPTGLINPAGVHSKVRRSLS